MIKVFNVFSKKNKQFFLFFTAFLWIVGIEKFIQQILPKYENNLFHGEKYNSINSVLNKVKINRFIMGDSRSHQGLIPSILDEHSNFKTWNFAAPGVSSPIMWSISDRMCKKTKIRAIIVNISFYLFSGTASCWLRDIYATYYRFSMKDLLIFYKFKILNLREILSFYIRPRIPSFRHQKRIKTLLKNWNLKETQKAALHQKDMMLSFERKGYFSRGIAHISECINTSTSWNKRIHAVPYIKMLRKFFEISEVYDVDIYVYQFPWPKQYKENSYFCDLLEFYTNLIQNQAKGLKKVHFLDNTLFYEHEYFSDPLHLNQKGSERLSKELNTLLNT